MSKLSKLHDCVLGISKISLIMLIWHVVRRAMRGLCVWAMSATKPWKQQVQPFKQYQQVYTGYIHGIYHARYIHGIYHTYCVLPRSCSVLPHTFSLAAAAVMDLAVLELEGSGRLWRRTVTWPDTSLEYSDTQSNSADIPRLWQEGKHHPHLPDSWVRVTPVLLGYVRPL